VLHGARVGRRGGVALARVFRACQHGGPSDDGSGGASTWPIEDRPGGAEERGMPGREAVTHLIPSEDRVLGETSPGAGAWRLVRSNRIDDTKGQQVFITACG
jgi:hypothetical protein